MATPLAGSVKKFIAVCFFLVVSSVLNLNSSAQIGLTGIDGKQSTTASLSIADGTVTTAEGQRDLNELRAIEFNRPVKSAARIGTISLAGGGQLGANGITLADEEFLIRNVAGEIKLGVDAVTRLQFKNNGLPLFDNAQAKEDLDQLFVKIEGNYQTVPGIVESISETEIGIYYDESTINFKVADAYGIILADSPGSETKINSVIHLTEGSTISCTLKTLTETEATAGIGEFAEVKIPANVISRIEFRSDRLMFLSDMQNLKVTSLGGGNLAGKTAKDKSVTGRPLMVRDPQTGKVVEFSKGLGTRSGIEMTFANSGFDRLVGLVGLDAVTGQSGNCQVTIIADGTSVFESAFLGTDKAKSLDLEISDVKDIQIRVEFGADFLDLSDHLNWCDIRMVKTSN